MTKTQYLFQATLMALCMSLCMSFLMAAVNVGFGSLFLFSWLRGWGIGFCAAWPLSMLLPMGIRKLIAKWKIP